MLSLNAVGRLLLLVGGSVLLVISAGGTAARPGDEPLATTFAVGTSRAATGGINVVSSPGCEPADISIPAEADVAVVGQRGGGADRALSTAGTPIDLGTTKIALPFTPRLPQQPIDGRILQMAFLTQATATMGFAFSTKPVSSTDSTFEFLDQGGFALSERPFAGQTGTLVYDSLVRDRWMVQIGEREAALVHADPYSPTLRPFGLYWADGELEYILIGAPASANDLIDFGRGMTCQG
jgi:hypothetical protein